VVYEPRHPEGHEVDRAALNLFSKVSGWTGRAAAWRIRRILRDTPQPGTKFVDIGTGPATILIHLKRFYPQVSLIGFDISLEMLHMAKAHSRRMDIPLKLLAGDGQFLPFRAKTFWVITSLFTLHHIDQPENLLRELDRVLKPNGTLLIIDFRRDMSPGLFLIMNTLWQLAFYCTAGRMGFRNSVRSAWRPDEIKDMLNQNDLGRFRVLSNQVELWITRDTGNLKMGVLR